MKTKLSLVLWVLLATVLPAKTHALTLSVLPASSSHALGEVFSVDVAVADVTNLASYQFDLGFDQTVLNAVAVTWGPFLGTGGSTITAIGTIDNAAGLIDSIAEVLITGSVSGSGVLAIVELRVVGAGTSSLNLVNPFFFDDNFVGLDVTLQNATVTTSQVTQVPEPPMTVPLAAALMAFVLWRRRRP